MHEIDELELQYEVCDSPDPVSFFYACKLAGKNWVKFGYYLPKYEEGGINLVMDRYSECHDLKVDPKFIREVGTPSGFNPYLSDINYHLRSLLAENGFVHPPGGEEDLFQPPPDMFSFDHVIVFIEEHLTEFLRQPVKFVSPPRDEEAIRKDRQMRTAAKQHLQRIERLEKLRWAQIESHHERAVLKASKKSSPTKQCANQLRQAVFEHYRSRANWQWKLIRKITDQAALKEKLEYFTKKETVIRREFEGIAFLGHQNHRSELIPGDWCSRQEKLERIVAHVIAKERISEQDEKDLRPLINIKHFLGL